MLTKLPPMPKSQEILNLSDWRFTLRAHVAHRASFRCEICHSFQAMHGDVDHVIPRRELEEKGLSPWDASNLQYLRASCHSQKTNKERWAHFKKSDKPKVWNRSKVPGRNLLLAVAGVKP